MKVIIISGPTGSGKTTLSKRILNKFQNGIELSTDNYYKAGLMSKVLSRIIDGYFDRKISFNYKLFKKDFKYICKNSKSNHIYTYNFINKTIKKSYKKERNIEYIIVEGIFTKEILRNFKNHNCLFIELETNKESCMKRVIKRDLIERGKSKHLAKIDFLKSWNLYYDKNHHSEKLPKKIVYSQKNSIFKEIKKKLNLQTYI
tara:strand:+ start:105 stop:710 length:606 start_codon:yes stop_codon:yes gene_type:complete